MGEPRAWAVVFFIYFSKSLCRVSVLALDKETFADFVYTECRLPRITLGKSFAECFLGFGICRGHMTNLGIPVVRIVGAATAGGGGDMTTVFLVATVVRTAASGHNS